MLQFVVRFDKEDNNYVGRFILLVPPPTKKGEDITAVTNKVRKETVAAVDESILLSLCLWVISATLLRG